MKVNLCTPNLKNEEEILNKIKYTIDTNWIASGGCYNIELEDAIKEYTGAKYAVSVASGTTALQLAYKAIGLKMDDEVIVPTATFIATINPIIYEKANPIFIDCDDELNINLDKVAKFLAQETEMVNGKCINLKTKKQIKLIVPVHIFGNPVDMDRLNEIVKPYNIMVAEDAAESLGSFFDNDKNVHTGLKSDIGIFSFNANKIITTGGGGMVVTNNKDYADKIRYWSEQSKDDTVRFIHNELGYNYRMSNIHAALGVEQMKLLEDFVGVKKAINERYTEKFSEIEGIDVLKFNDETRPNYWFTNILVTKEGIDINEIIDTLQSKYDIQTRPLWFLNHNQAFLNKYQTFEIDKANKFIKQVISLPCSTHLTNDEQDYVVEVVSRLINE